MGRLRSIHNRIIRRRILRLLIRRNLRIQLGRRINRMELHSTISTIRITMVPHNGWFSNSPQIADGKLYYANGEHSPTQPLARGWKLWCLDALTGQELWNISGGGSAGAIADGYLTYDNRYDGTMYVFGKGKTQTTVTAPQIEIVQDKKQ